MDNISYHKKAFSYLQYNTYFSNFGPDTSYKFFISILLNPLKPKLSHNHRKRSRHLSHGKQDRNYKFLEIWHFFHVLLVCCINVTFGLRGSVECMNEYNEDSILSVSQRNKISTSTTRPHSFDHF